MKNDTFAPKKSLLFYHPVTIPKEKRKTISEGEKTKNEWTRSFWRLPGSIVVVFLEQSPSSVSKFV